MYKYDKQYFVSATVFFYKIELKTDGSDTANTT